MKKTISTGIIAVLLLVISSCATSNIREANGPAKNVVLMIGDGMGIAQLYSAMAVYEGDLNIATFKHIGFSKTHSFDNWVTDSGASGTAMATGVKTRNHMIGMASDTTKLTNLIELAHGKGLSGGVVSTSAVTHATPAAFVAHNPNRNDYEGIAEDFIKTHPEVFIGGGLNHFAKRRDSTSLLTWLEDMDYDIVYNIDDMVDSKSDHIAGLLAPVHMPKISEGRGDFLSYASLKALTTLSNNNKGFFLMIEGSQIDWAAHAHDSKYLIDEVIDFDRAVGTVLDFAKKDGNTLVIVTADHETGGLTLVAGDNDKPSVSTAYSTGGHTGVAVPVFAFGPGSEMFEGFYENTEIFERIKLLLGL